MREVGEVLSESARREVSSQLNSRSNIGKRLGHGTSHTDLQLILMLWVVPTLHSETFHQFVTGESDGQVLTFLAVFEGRGVWRGATEGRQFDNDGFDVKALQKLAEGELSPESEYIELEGHAQIGHCNAWRLEATS